MRAGADAVRRAWLPGLAPALALALALAGCGEAPRETRGQFLVFGTLVEITLFDVPAALGERALARAEAELARMHRAWHAWEAGELTRINAALAAGEPAPVDPELAALIRRAKDLAARSNHLFNPAMGRLIALWGFHRDALTPLAPPDPAAVQALVAAAPTMAAVHVADARVRSTDPDVQLDFGAFAKGWAIDRVIALLRALDIDHAIVNAGGDLRAIGRHGERPWRIGIRHPRAPGVLAALELNDDEAVVTSGDYERFFEHDGVRYHHILDPRSGRPARGLTSVTVLHEEAATADAAATALFVAGPDGWRETARALGLAAVMVVDAAGTVHLTPAMARRVEWVADPAPPHQVETLP